MDLLAPEILAYIEAHTEEEPRLLQQLHRETYLKTLYPRMISGHYQGRLLAMLSHLLQPRRVLEIGTFTGYSSICLAEGLAEDGRIITIEANPELAFIIEPWLKKAGIQEQVEVRYGDAMEVIATLNETWDLVFIDADKAQYPAYFEAVVPAVRRGGLILADNVLWSGKVVDETDQSKELAGIRAFNEKVKQDPRVKSLLLPVRDGLMLLRKC